MIKFSWIWLFIGTTFLLLLTQIGVYSLYVYYMYALQKQAQLQHTIRQEIQLVEQAIAYESRFDRIKQKVVEQYNMQPLKVRSIKSLII